MHANRNNVVNFIGFQIVWFAAVFGAAKGVLWPCYLITCLFAIWQLYAQHRHQNDLLLLAVALPIGFVSDSAWQLFGLVDYASNSLWPPFAPAWILCLWLAFTLTFNHSLAWLKNQPGLIILFGLIGSPLSYWAGAKLGAMAYLTSPLKVSLIFSLSWALILSLLFYIARKPTLTEPTHA